MPLRFGLPEFSGQLAKRYPQITFINTAPDGFFYRKEPIARETNRQSFYSLQCSIRETLCEILMATFPQTDYPKDGKPVITGFFPKPRYISCKSCTAAHPLHKSKH